MWAFECECGHLGVWCEPQNLQLSVSVGIWEWVRPAKNTVKCDYVTMSVSLVTCDEYDIVESGDASLVRHPGKDAGGKRQRR